MAAYYNEIDPYAAQWLRNLIDKGLIAPGDVDERDIRDVCANDLGAYAQCHFFAGIGVWAYALEKAGWPHSRLVWTGSCPCQPFSQAGKGAGFTDERHLWPYWFHLISEHRPPIIFGEQVAGKNGLAWFDLVQTDMEGLEYACGAVPFPAAGVGAPHIRERLYWMADAGEQRCARIDPLLQSRRQDEDSFETARCGEVIRMGDSESERRKRRTNDRDEGRRQCASGQAGVVSRLDDSEGSRRCGRRQKRCSELGRPSEISERPGPTNGFWRDSDWLLCTDGKWRPVEPGTFPLVDGTPERVGRLRAYGNAIVAPQAQEFIEAAMEYMP